MKTLLNILVQQKSLRFQYLEHFKRNFSATAANQNKLTNFEIDGDGIATLTLKNTPVNALGIDLFNEIKDNLYKLEDSKPKGLILTSEIKSIFSAGLDLKELYKPDPERVRILWGVLQDVCNGLYSAGYPIVAAMNGHSIAGGCALAFACEYRIMLPNYMIGLNETRVGLHVPKWLIAHTKNVLPRRLAEAALLEGRLFTAAEALKFGLIDEIAKDNDDLKHKSSLFFKKFEKVPRLARDTTKQLFRSKDVEEFEAIRKEDLENFLFVVQQTKFQDNLGRYLEDLKKKKISNKN